MEKLDVSVLRKLLRYEPDTGKLYWHERTPDMFKDGKHSAEHNCARWNIRFAGKEAFTASSYGYKVGDIFGSRQSAHRVAYAISHGHWPKDAIDHIDGNRANNCIDNLRAVTWKENHMAMRVNRKSASSRFRGVSWDKKRKKWLSSIVANSKQKNLGRYESEHEAARAYDRAAEEAGFFKEALNRTRFPEINQDQ